MFLEKDLLCLICYNLKASKICKILLEIFYFALIGANSFCFTLYVCVYVSNKVKEICTKLKVFLYITLMKTLHY